MTREWKPGDVLRFKDGSLGLITKPTGRPLRVEYAEGGFDYPSGGMRSGPRPLVVIDAEDREQVERLADLMPPCESPATCGQPVRCMGTRLREALREFANPKPRIEEPKGLGAVVEDADGIPWVRCENAEREPHWYARNKMRDYSAIDAVRVLSEGVQP